jgi:subtilisin family serine protease/subtilisin-like proprotein convertase family protein
LNGLSVAPGYDPSKVLVRFRGAPFGLPGATVDTSLGLVSGLYDVRLAPGLSVDKALGAYRADPRVLSAEPDYYLVSSAVPNNPLFGQQWGLQNTGANGGTPGADVHAVPAWDIAQGSPQVVVAVMDTGVDYNHPDLYQNIWINQAEIPYTRLKNLVDYRGDGYISFADLNDPRNQGVGKITDVNGDGRIDAADILAPMVLDAKGNDTGLGGWAYPGNTQDGDTAHPNDFIGWNSNTNTNNPYDDNGHGTHVAGILGAVGNNGLGVAGVDWNVQLMPVKFLNADGRGSTDQFIAGLSYAIAHGARITNNSWDGAGPSQNLIDAIATAWAHGQIFVAAAGNNATDIDRHPSYPSSFSLSNDNVVSVAATDRNDNLAGTSNYGARTVDLAAPGVDILSTVPGGGYGTRSGTSMATPFVTGALALVWGQHPDWSYQQVIAQVLWTTDGLPSLAGKTLTGGRLDLAAALGDPIDPKWTHASRPAIVSATFGGPAANVLGSARVTFDRAMDASTFTAASASVVGPAGAVKVLGVSVVDGSGNRAFDVSFVPQSAPGTYTLSLAGVRDTAGGVSAPFQATYTIDNLVTYSSRTVAAVLPGRYAVSLLSVNDDFSVGRLSVSLDITAPRASDLLIHLQGPDGTDVVLARGAGGGGPDFRGTVFDDRATTSILNGKSPLTGTFLPIAPLSNFIGKKVRGYWKLWVEDRGGKNRSTLNSWSLRIAPAAPKPAAAAYDVLVSSILEAASKKHRGP